MEDRRRLLIGVGLAVVAALALTTCSFGPLDRKLTALRLEGMSRWAPDTAVGVEYSENGATPLNPFGTSMAFIQRRVTLADAREAESGVAAALAAADSDGWLQGQYTDPQRSREKTLLLGVRGDLDVYVSSDSPNTLVINLTALE
jgi:hypothetical protein